MLEEVMNQLARVISLLTFVGAVSLACLIVPADVSAQNGGWQPAVESLRTQMAILNATVESQAAMIKKLSDEIQQQNLQNAAAMGAYVTVDNANTINGVKPPHIFITGANVHIVNGTNSTHTVNGTGNLLIGYNATSGQNMDANRMGSHNLIVGNLHQYPSSGGLVAGDFNTISGMAASVIGGQGSTAMGTFSSVCGGSSNSASGEASSVLGGDGNAATNMFSAVAGGEGNLASGLKSSVDGGLDNTASGDWSSVGGGQSQTAAGAFQNIN